MFPITKAEARILAQANAGIVFDWALRMHQHASPLGSFYSGEVCPTPHGGKIYVRTKGAVQFFELYGYSPDEWDVWSDLSLLVSLLPNKHPRKRVEQLREALQEKQNKTSMPTRVIALSKGITRACEILEGRV